LEGGDIDVISSILHESEWYYIIPGTLGESIYNAVIKSMGKEAIESSHESWKEKKRRF